MGHTVCISKISKKNNLGVHTYYNSHTNSYEVVKALGDDDEMKFYGVVAMCGHCGNGYFIPVMYGIVASSMESAKKYVLNFPRIKRDTKNCILYATEISQEQKNFLDYINSNDEFLKYNNNCQIDKRRVVCPEILRNSNLENFDVKYSHQFSNERVLQRYFAPEMSMGKAPHQKFVYKKIAKKEFLNEYFYYNAYRLGVKKGKAKALVFYLKNFGKDNPDGVYLQGDEIYYNRTNKKGEVVLKSVKLTENQLNYLQGMETLDIQDETNEVVEDLSQTQWARKNQIDKFKEKLEKSKVTQNKLKDIPKDKQ